MLLQGAELWTHTKVTNPTAKDIPGYWWTCAAHSASPGTRIVAPAERVTVETYVGSALRDAPWPAFEAPRRAAHLSEGGSEVPDWAKTPALAFPSHERCHVRQNLRSSID